MRQRWQLEIEILPVGVEDEVDHERAATGLAASSEY
jgi:hypothetical protein